MAVPRVAPSSLARRALLRLLEEQAATGSDVLPGLRELAEALGVSLMTARKVVQGLAAEGRIRVVPNKGHYLVRLPRRLEIGLICESGSDSWMMKTRPVLRGILDTLEQADCCVRMIFTTRKSQIRSAFAGNCFDGCFWYLPEPPQFAQVQETMRLADFPVIPVIQRWAMAREAELPAYSVAADHYAIGAMRARYLLKKGHRNIARLNVDFVPQRGDEGEEYCGFVAELSEAGVRYSPAWSIPPSQMEHRLPALLEQQEVTAAVVNGGPLEMFQVFRILSGHPRGRQLALLPDDIGPSLAELIDTHPDLRVVGVNVAPDYELGCAAAGGLLRHLLQKQPLQACKVPPAEPKKWRRDFYRLLPRE